MMFRLLQATFLSGPALVYFIDTAKLAAISPNEAIQLLESRFLDGQAERVNDEVWLELTFSFVRNKWMMLEKEVSHEKNLK